MKRRTARCVLPIAVALSIGSTAIADDVPQVERRSGYSYMTRDTQAMQDDDAVNPGSLWVLDGEALWEKKAGAANRSCAECHGDAAFSMKGVAARYPAFDSANGRPVNLEQRIKLCRSERQQASPLRYESRDLLALAAFVGRQSRDMPIETGADDKLKPFIDAGREIYLRRQGQLNLACNHCHDDNPGGKLAGAVVPQAHPTGYPLYRLEWQGLGSLQRRLRGCIYGMRAESYEYGAPELVDLELYLMTRSRGMAVETPAVRP